VAAIGLKRESRGGVRTWEVVWAASRLSGLLGYPEIQSCLKPTTTIYIVKAISTTKSSARRIGSRAKVGERVFRWPIWLFWFGKVSAFCTSHDGLKRGTAIARGSV
jgi:hypothetical protein